MVVMKGTNTRERLLVAVQSLMPARGFTATSVDDVCRQARVSKGSFYHFLRSKDQAASEALVAYFDRVERGLLEGAHMLEPDPVARALGLADHVASAGRDLWNDGSLAGAFAIDAAPALREELAVHFRRLGDRLARIFDAALSARGHTGKPSGRGLANHFLACIEGAVVLARIHGDIRYVRRAARRFRHYLELLLG